MRIVVLEDNAERCEAMRDCLSDRLYTFGAHFFADAKQTIAFLAEHADDTIAISLDHDLEPALVPGQFAPDPGTGRDVVDFLAARPPIFPVLIHSSNSAAAAGMNLALTDAGWNTHVTTPYGDLDWIAELWLPTLRRAILDHSVTHAAAGSH
jgi:CheY-like chemotaxis protein